MMIERSKDRDGIMCWILAREGDGIVGVYGALRTNSCAEATVEGTDCYDRVNLQDREGQSQTISDGTVTSDQHTRLDPIRAST